jgi:ribosomal protein L11 methyltransferase
VEAEAALAELLELAPGGVEEVSEPDGRADFVEYAIYGAAGELPELAALKAAVGGALVEVRAEPVPDDWSERWKRFYHPLLVGGRIYVRPPWERPAERGRVVEVVIEPGQAFGTGTHPTTRMCLELLLEADPGRSRLLALIGRRERRSFCDLGCGSGVLAIAAAKLGFDPVLGIDVEQAALAETARNGRLNYVEIETRRLDLRTDPPPLGDLVTANLSVGLLERVAERWATAERRPRRVIAAGFLEAEAARVGDVLTKAGLKEKRRLRDGDWTAVVADPV